MTCMGPRLLRGVLAAALLLGALPKIAVAIDVQCIEESKYKHLYQLFGGDTRKFAAYFKIGTGRLPDPEACRAALITGGIGEPNDREKLLDFVVQNKGWLATVHLNSGGGSVPSTEIFAPQLRQAILTTRPRIFSS